MSEAFLRRATYLRDMLSAAVEKSDSIEFGCSGYASASYAMQLATGELFSFLFDNDPDLNVRVQDRVC